MSARSPGDVGVPVRQRALAVQSRRSCAFPQWAVGRLSADKSMSPSLCLVRPNMPEADHSATAYKLKQIVLSMLYYLVQRWVLFQTSHREVVLIPARLMTKVLTSFACFKLRMSNGQIHDFMRSDSTEWFVIHYHCDFLPCCYYILQSNSIVYNWYVMHSASAHPILRSVTPSQPYKALPETLFLSQRSVYFQGTIGLEMYKPIHCIYPRVSCLFFGWLSWI